MISLPEKKFWQWTSARASVSRRSYFGPYVVAAL